jgi:poly(3-hydroxyalkanoate) synthetase
MPIAVWLTKSQWRWRHEAKRRPEAIRMRVNNWIVRRRCTMNARRRPAAQVGGAIENARG